MIVAMVEIGEVRVAMAQPAMPVAMAVRFADVLPRFVVVLVVFVMHMGVLVFERLMHVLVVVMLCEVQVQAQTHQRGRRDQLPR